MCVSLITKLSSTVSLKVQLVSVRNEYYLVIHCLEIIQAFKALKKWVISGGATDQGALVSVFNINIINFGATNFFSKTICYSVISYNMYVYMFCFLWIFPCFLCLSVRNLASFPYFSGKVSWSLMWTCPFQ